MEKIEVTREEVKQELFQKLEEQNFNERERKILELRFFSSDLPSMKEIGSHLSLSDARVYQIIAKVRRKARHPSRKTVFSLLQKYGSLLPDGKKKEAFFYWLEDRGERGFQEKLFKLLIEPHSKVVEKKIQERWKKSHFTRKFFVIPGKERWSDEDELFFRNLQKDGVLTTWKVVSEDLAEKWKRRAYLIECDTTEEAEELLEKMRRRAILNNSEDVLLEIRDEKNVYMEGMIYWYFDEYIKRHYLEELTDGYSEYVENKEEKYEGIGTE